MQRSLVVQHSAGMTHPGETPPARSWALVPPARPLWLASTASSVQCSSRSLLFAAHWCCLAPPLSSVEGALPATVRQNMPCSANIASFAWLTADISAWLRSLKACLSSAQPLSTVQWLSGDGAVLLRRPHVEVQSAGSVLRSSAVDCVQLRCSCVTCSSSVLHQHTS